jgi:hypothetical protein
MQLLKKECAQGWTHTIERAGGRAWAFSWHVHVT